MWPFWAGSEGVLEWGRGGAGVRPAVTPAAGSQPPSIAARLYSEAFVSAPAQKLAQEQVDPSVTLHPFPMEPPGTAWLPWGAVELPDYHCVPRWAGTSRLGLKFIICYFRPPAKITGKVSVWPTVLSVLWLQYKIAVFVLVGK